MEIQKTDIKKFQKVVWDFYLPAPASVNAGGQAGKKNKRDFPWRQTLRRGSGQAYNPYHILVSEIMLQQTQADRVVRYFENWIKRFPDFTSLAQATFSEIYPYWQGLGYNRRALALKRTAEKAVKEFGGKLPTNIATLEQFPGIGPYTARAVSIFSFNTPIVCIETNIRRVFIHHFFFDRRSLGEGGSQAKLVTDKEILKIAELALDKKNPREWHWALMDYGAYLKKGIVNPNRRHKSYSVQSKFEGSLRQIRGVALRILSGEATDLKTLTIRIKKATSQDAKRTRKVIEVLEKEGLIQQNKKIYSLT